MDTTPKPAPISRRESLKRAAGALALGLGAPVTALAATEDDGSISFRLSFWKGNRREAFHTLRLSERDGKRIRSSLGESGATAFIKFDDVDGESVETIASFYLKMD